ncbi:hypothetical protein D3C71_2036950 [compost metagenome]
MSFTVEESMHIIYDLDSSNIMMWEFVQYIGKQRKEQQYNDYQGVPITPERIGALMAIITA